MKQFLLKIFHCIQKRIFRKEYPRELQKISLAQLGQAKKIVVTKKHQQQFFQGNEMEKAELEKSVINYDNKFLQLNQIMKKINLKIEFKTSMVLMFL